MQLFDDIKAQIRHILLTMASLPIQTAGIAANAVTQSSRLLINTGNITTTSTIMVDLTGVTITITTGANPVMIFFQAQYNHSASDEVHYDIAIDGTRVGKNAGFAGGYLPANVPRGVSINYLSEVLSAGSHTFKVMWYTVSGTATTYANVLDQSPIHFAVIELKK